MASARRRIPRFGDPITEYLGARLPEGRQERTKHFPIADDGHIDEIAVEITVQKRERDGLPFPPRLSKREAMAVAIRMTREGATDQDIYQRLGLSYEDGRGQKWIRHLRRANGIAPASHNQYTRDRATESNWMKRGRIIRGSPAEWRLHSSTRTAHGVTHTWADDNSDVFGMVEHASEAA